MDDTCFTKNRKLFIFVSVFFQVSISNAWLEGDINDIPLNFRVCASPQDRLPTYAMHNNI